MAKRLLLYFLALLPVYAAPPVSNRYALVLADPPVSEVHPTRAGMRSPAATAYRAQLRTRHATVRTQLTSRNLVVTGEVDTLLNAIFVSVPASRVAELSRMPGVAGVIPLRTYRLALNRATTLVNASGAWNALGGVSNAGLGVKIGILDTGIDQTHPAFVDPLLVAPGGYPICSGSDCAFTSNKVIVARSYVKMLAAGSNASNPAANSRPDDISPRDRTGHGTAVASVAAGNTSGGLVTITGMAPHAFLGNYRIFGSPGVNDTTSDDVIITAAEDAINDGMDIISLSLGTPTFSGPLDVGSICGQSAGVACDPLASAMEAAAKAGMIIVVAAGNNGSLGSTPSYNTIASPGDAPSVITVGASTNSHTFVQKVSVPGTSQIYDAHIGNGKNPSTPLTAPGVDIGTLGSGPLGCASLPTGSLTGSIAFIQRGTCTFLIKLQNAIAAGAIGVVFYMADGAAPIAPGGLGGTTVLAVMVSNSDGISLKSYLNANPGRSVTIDPAQSEELLPTYNQLASFSSQGPVTGTSAMKPELLAVGSNLYMAAETYDPLGDLYSPTGYSVANGTSFAAPMVAGAAAMVKQLHPSWTSAQVKSALVNSATQDVTQDDSGYAVTAQSIGAGKLDAGAAMAATVTSNPATISFGALIRLPASQQIVLTNNGFASVTLGIANDNAHGAAGVSMAISPSGMTLAPGATAAVTVSLSGTTPAAGSYSGSLVITGNNTGNSVAMRIPYLYMVAGGTATNIIPIYGDAWDGTVQEITYVAFKLVDAHGLPVTFARATFTASNGASVVASNPTTDNYGIGLAEVKLGSTPGSFTFVASSGGLSYTFTTTARATPAITVSGIVNAASSTLGAASPGSIITIFGSALSDFTDSASGVRLPMAIDSVTVSFDAPGISVPGHLFFVSPGQINVQVPWELLGQTSAQVKVRIDNTYGNVVTLPLASASPAFFESTPGVSSTLDAAFRLISQTNPASIGQTVLLYVNGLGAVSNTPASGDPASTSILSQTTVIPTVKIAGIQAQVAFSGLAPGFAGLYQINVVIPPGVPSGLQPITIAVGDQLSKSSGIYIK